MKNVVLIILSVIFLGGCMAGETQYSKMGSLQLTQKQVSSKKDLSELSLAIAKPEVIINFQASNNLKASLGERIRYDALNLACFLSQEMKRMLVAKGFTVTETFDSLNSMTFTQKRNTSALFTAFIKIDISEDTMSELKEYVPQRAFGSISSTAKLQIATVEPLSGEIIWLKNVPINDSSIEINYPYYQSVNATESLIPDELVSTAQSIDGIFILTNNQILDAIDKFVDVKEFQFLNDDIIKLKKIKRY
jgi:hypothetical protein